MSLGVGDLNNQGYYAFSPIFWMQAGEVSRIASRQYRTPQPNATSAVKTSALILPRCSWSGGALHCSRAWPGLPSPSSCVSTCQVSCCGPSVLWLLQDAAGRQQSTGSVLLGQDCRLLSVLLSFPLSFPLRRNPLVLRFWLWGKDWIYWAFNGRMRSHMKT